MNVLIYNGNGTSKDAVQQTYNTLKSILGHAYDVMQVDATTLQKEPWQDSCSLLVIPGGRDTPYCQDLKDVPIASYVRGGGRYMGLCAGAYFASAHIEFEKDTKLEIVGDRALGFFPGLSRGTMYPGFVYNSEKGARSVSIRQNQTSNSFKAYYNGGGYFVNAEKAENVKVICTFEDPGLNDENETAAAAVQCQVGKGQAILFGFHPEYDIRDIDLSENEQGEKIKKELEESLEDCRNLLRQLLKDMGMNVMQQQEKEQIVPELSPLYLATISKELLQALTSKLLNETDDKGIFKDSNDYFHISQMNGDDFSSVAELLKNLSVERESQNQCPVLQIHYPEAKVSDTGFQLPDKSATPHFDLKKYFEALLKRRGEEWGGGAWYRFGNAAFYSEVITSTQTVLDKYGFYHVEKGGH